MDILPELVFSFAFITLPKGLMSPYHHLVFIRENRYFSCLAVAASETLISFYFARGFKRQLELLGNAFFTYVP